MGDSGRPDNHAQPQNNRPAPGLVTHCSSVNSRSSERMIDGSRDGSGRGSGRWRGGEMTSASEEGRGGGGMKGKEEVKRWRR